MPGSFHEAMVPGPLQPAFAGEEHIYFMYVAGPLGVTIAKYRDTGKLFRLFPLLVCFIGALMAGYYAEVVGQVVALVIYFIIAMTAIVITALAELQIHDANGEIDEELVQLCARMNHPSMGALGMRRCSISFDRAFRGCGIGRASYRWFLVVNHVLNPDVPLPHDQVHAFSTL